MPSHTQHTVQALVFSRPRVRRMYKTKSYIHNCTEKGGLLER